jgi:molybdate transport system substrate-binding protein
MRRRLLPSLALLLAAPALGRAQDVPLTVFAAASLQDGLKALEPAWRAAAPGNPPLRLAFAASSALARQLEQGAPADLFMSADEPWMDWAQQRNLIVPETRISPLGNALVLVAPADTPLPPMTLARDINLAALLGAGGRLAVGDPAHVPAGIYARQALTWMGQWAALGPRLARAESVRAGLLLVERGEAPLGIVYATDALASRRVKLLGRFPAESHTPVTYPCAVTRRAADNPRARALLGFLSGPAAAPTWRELGFTLRPG